MSQTTTYPDKEGVSPPMCPPAEPPQAGYLWQISCCATITGEISRTLTIISASSKHCHNHYFSLLAGSLGDHKGRDCYPHFMGDKTEVHGNSLVMQWLWLGACTAEGPEFSPWLGKLRSCKLHHAAKQKLKCPGSGQRSPSEPMADLELTNPGLAIHYSTDENALIMVSELCFVWESVWTPGE